MWFCDVLRCYLCIPNFAINDDWLNLGRSHFWNSGSLDEAFPKHFLVISDVSSDSESRMGASQLEEQCGVREIFKTKVCDTAVWLRI